MGQRIFVAVNPASANGRTGKRWPELASALRARVGDFEVGFTEGPREATTLVRRALRGGADLIVSVGGDGTHNEVVNGFFEDGALIKAGATLALVPTGTGGDLRKTVGLPADPVEAMAQVGQDPRPVDVGRLTYTAHDGTTAQACFINIASFGLSGLVDKIVNESSKALGGKTSFLLGVLRASFRYKNQKVRLTLDGGASLERTVNNVAVANARFYGGGMQVAPLADMSDGLFDVMVLGDLGLLDMTRGLPAIYKGRHVGMDKIEHLRARTVVAEPTAADQVVLIDMDGEQPGRLPATFELLPGVLNLCFGPKAAPAAAPPKAD